MSKAERLNEMILMVNRKKRFTVGELSQNFGVSKRTILRDLQELSLMGVPLYSEVGPHGGYQVLRERILPPIKFSEDEAVSIFFAIHALRHYLSLPFDSEYEAIEKKFYLNLSGDTRDLIDRMKDRVDFMTVKQKDLVPFLRLLLDSAIRQTVIQIGYEKDGKIGVRSIQPIGIYASEGRWFCPAYCFLKKDYRLFRCDRIKWVEPDDLTVPLDLSQISLQNRFSVLKNSKESLPLYVELTKAGVDRIRFDKWPNIQFNKREDGSGYLEGTLVLQDIDFFSNYLIGFGENVVVKKPTALINGIKEKIAVILNQYQ